MLCAQCLLGKGSALLFSFRPSIFPAVWGIWTGSPPAATHHNCIYNKIIHRLTLPHIDVHILMFQSIDTHICCSLSIFVCESKRWSTCRGGLKGRLLPRANPNKPQPTGMESGGTCVCVCVLNTVRVCIQLPSCSQNNPLLRIFNPHVTALFSLYFLLFITPSHIGCMLHTHSHTQTQPGCVCWCKASQNSGLVGIIC